MSRLVKRLLVAAAVTVLIFIAVGTWQTASSVAEVLRVGGPSAQGEGWPEPKVPADIGYTGDPGKAFGLAFSEVSIEGPLGSMPAWLIPADDGAATSRWAIFVHGVGGRRENGYRFVPALHDSGLTILMITYRNDEQAPRSDDRLYSFGLNEWPDLEAGVSYALGAGASEIVLVAESMGGGIAGQFLRHSSAAGNVVALVLDAPAIDFPASVTNEINRMGLPLAPVLTMTGLWLSGIMLPVHIGDAVTSDVFESYPGPLFLSHGTADRVVPVATSDALAKGRAGPTKYLRTSAAHIASWHEDPAAFELALARFLAELPVP